MVVVLSVLEPQMHGKDASQNRKENSCAIHSLDDSKKTLCIIDTVLQCLISLGQKTNKNCIAETERNTVQNVSTERFQYHHKAHMHTERKRTNNEVNSDEVVNLMLPRDDDVGNSFAWGNVVHM